MSNVTPSDPEPVRLLLERLRRVRKTQNGWSAACPGHDDRYNSLSVAVTGDGTVLVKCFAGCATKDIVAGVGLGLRDLFPSPDHLPRQKPRAIAATYDYKDERGQVLFQVVRYEPKAFRQRQPEGRDGWRWDIQGVRRVPYRLPQLLAADPGKVVWVVEGERDANRLAELGEIATTNAGGAGKWGAEETNALSGRIVCIMPDNDEAGRKHAQLVARALLGVAQRVHVLELPNLPARGDVSDWLDLGGSRKELWELADASPDAQTWLAALDGQTSTATDKPEPKLVVRCLADVPPRPVEWLWPGRLALGKLAILDGDPGLGKSLVTLDLCAHVTRGRPLPDGAKCPSGSVIIVNCEDGVGDTIRPRLEALGADIHRVHLLCGPEVDGREQLPSFPRDLDRLAAAIRATSAVLVVIDPVMAFLDETICSGNDQSVRQALAPLAVLAEQTSCAVLLVRHLNKAGGARAVYRGGGSIGIIGACRSAWLIARNPNDEKQRVLAQVKNNLGKPQPSLGYEVVSDEQGRPQVAWLGVIELSADQLVGTGSGTVEDLSELERAVELLREALAQGPRPVAEVQRELARQGVGRRTLYRAKKEAGVESNLETTAKGAQAIWRLPPPPPQPAPGVDAGLEPLELHLEDLSAKVLDRGPYGERY
jgi:hypothetical protein